MNLAQIENLITLASIGFDQVSEKLSDEEYRAAHGSIKAMATLKEQLIAQQQQQQAQEVDVSESETQEIIVEEVTVDEENKE